MPRVSDLLFSACAFVIALLPQAAVPGPSFEAASIREHTAPLQVVKGLTISSTLVRFEAYSPWMLVQEAYDLKPYEIAFAAQPPASAYVYYDIMARAPGDGKLNKVEMRPMLQSLLADRLQLKFHRESRQLDVYALTIAKNGPKLKESSGDAECRNLIGPVKPQDRNNRYSFTHCPLSVLVEVLPSVGLSRPLIDQTGLTGNYDILFSATPEFRLQNSTEVGDVSVFDVLPSELGLRLESRKAPFDVLVIDHLEKPVEN
jgi:uncharacterized protein (TIGR03435 family)